MLLFVLDEQDSEITGYPAGRIYTAKWKADTGFSAGFLTQHSFKCKEKYLFNQIPDAWKCSYTNLKYRILF
jgi:hypothetical protein